MKKIRLKSTIEVEENRDESVKLINNDLKEQIWEYFFEEGKIMYFWKTIDNKEYLSVCFTTNVSLWDRIKKWWNG